MERARVGHGEGREEAQAVPLARLDGGWAASWAPFSSRFLFKEVAI